MRRSRSNIAQLPDEIQGYINALLKDGVTYKAILEKLQELGVDTVSHSGLGRHYQGLKEQAERANKYVVMAESFLQGAQGQGDDVILKASTQMVGSLLLQLADNAIKDEGKGLNSQDTRNFAQALNNLTRAQKTFADMDIDAAKALVEQAKEEVNAPASTDGAVFQIETIEAKAPEQGSGQDASEGEEPDSETGTDKATSDSTTTDTEMTPENASKGENTQG